MQEGQTERYVTVSVDDGHPTDMKTVDLLHKYGLQATFYTPARNPERAVLSASQIKELSRQFEVGSHTFNHTPLNGLPRDQAWAEICNGKKWLEDLLGEPVVSFCYPRGKFNGTTTTLVRDAGFWGARTCLYHLQSFPRNPFLWGVSTHAHDHSRMIRLRHAFLEGNFSGAWSYFRTHKGVTNWQIHFLHALDYVEKHGGVAHLYLHSWEIEDCQEWKLLESTFDSIARRNLTTVTNGMLFRLWNTRHNNGRIG
jgi:peptidoglycan/xylan/chitin deacetylase (PgdA/CDA1 family)